MNIDKLKIATNAKKYLGYKEEINDLQTIELIDQCIEESIQYSDFRKIYKTYTIKVSKDIVHFTNSEIILKSNDLAKLLGNSEKCVVMACTLGVSIEKRINLYKRRDMTKCIVMDAVATALIENLCDDVEESIRSKAALEQQSLTWRYSPGYGDLGLVEQKALIDTLDATKKIGLTYTDQFLLIPRKSVTAIIGIGDNDHLNNKEEKTCSRCELKETCLFKQEGKNCGS